MPKKENKTILKTIRLSEDDYNKIEKRASDLNMTFSKYIRTIAVDGKIQKLVVPEFTNVMTELNRIGSNINQIARRLNEQGSFYYEDLADMKEEHEKLCHMLNQYLSTLHLTEL